MRINPSFVVEPRKQPVQARSTVTVDAVFEATIQVLLNEGIRRLTTTRVADRAGVSVGTLYQYFPNKEALLYAVLQRHLSRVADAVEAAAFSARFGALSTMVDLVVDAFVRAKIERIDEARALYSVANELLAADLVKAAGKRGVVAISAMLSTARNVRFDDLALTSHMFLSAMAGPTRAILEGDLPPRMLRALRGQLVSLCLGYLEREALTRSRRRGTEETVKSVGNRLQGRGVPVRSARDSAGSA